MTDRNGEPKVERESPADFFDVTIGSVKRNFEKAKHSAEQRNPIARQELLGAASQAANVIEILVGKTDTEIPDREEKIREMQEIAKYWEEWRLDNPEK